MSTPIDNLDLPKKIKNILQREGFESFEQLSQALEQEDKLRGRPGGPLLRLPGFANASLEHCRRAVRLWKETKAARNGWFEARIGGVLAMSCYDGRRMVRPHLWSMPSDRPDSEGYRVLFEWAEAYVKWNEHRKSPYTFPHLVIKVDLGQLIDGEVGGVLDLLVHDNLDSNVVDVCQLMWLRAELQRGVDSIDRAMQDVLRVSDRVIAK